MSPPALSVTGSAAPRAPRPRLGPALVRLSVLGAAWVLLYLARLQALGLPGPWDAAAFAHRLHADGAFLATVAVAHQALLVLGGYAIVLGTAGVVLQAVVALGPRPAARRATVVLRCMHRVSLPGLSSLLGWSVGVVALAGSISVPVASASPASPPPTMVELTAPPPASPGAGSGRGAPSMSALPRARPPRLVAPPTEAVAPSPSSAPLPPRSVTRPSVRSTTAAPPTSGAPPLVRPRPVPVAAPAPLRPPVPAAAPLGTPPAAAVPTPAPAPPAGPTDPADVAPTATTPGVWVVQPGDHLWSISERTLAAAEGTPPDLATLGPYWWEVVTANRATLPDPADIDLLFPGDVVTLPPLPPRV